jgi:hypothetical protein
MITKELFDEIVDKELSEDQIWNIIRSGELDKLTSLEVAYIQLHQSTLLVEFSRFQNSLEKVLKQPIYTHQLATCANEIRKAVDVVWNEQSHDFVSHDHLLDGLEDKNVMIVGV